jgi:hypothetical protein
LTFEAIDSYGVVMTRPDPADIVMQSCIDKVMNVTARQWELRLPLGPRKPLQPVRCRRTAPQDWRVITQGKSHAALPWPGLAW